MKKNWKVLVFLFSTSLVLLYFFFPQLLLQTTYKWYEWKAGVQKKTVQIDGATVHYYEGGQGKNLVMLHGFADSKMTFLLMSRHLTPHYRVVFPDLLGFGDNAFDAKTKHSIRKQAHFVQKFAKQLQLESFVLVGQSMGGHIATSFALQYPKQVKKLVLMNAAGLTTPKIVLYKPAPKRTMTENDFKEFMKKVFVKPPYAPKQVVSFLAKKAIANFDNNQRILKDIREGQDAILNSVVPKIKHPTLVIWGDTDRIVPVEIGKLYHQLLPQSQWFLLKRCGHAPQYEYPKKTAERILVFAKEK